MLYYGLIMLLWWCYGSTDAEFKIFALFSNIISNLTKPIIKDVIKKCDKFTIEFSKLYPEDMHRYNVHVINTSSS